MGVLAAFSTLVSAMIGSAIFSLSGITIEQSGGWSAFSWAISGVIMLLYALIVCRLCYRFPRSGGLYYFPRFAFSRKKLLGPFLGFLSSIGTVICNIIAISFSAILIPIFLNISGQQAFLLAGIAILICFGMNLLNIGFRGIINTIFAFTLIALLLFYSFAIFLSKNGAENLLNSFSLRDSSTCIFNILKSIPISSVGYGAIVSVCFIAGDMKDKKRGLRNAVIFAGLAVIFIYVISIIATLNVVEISKIGESGSVFYTALEKAFSTSPFLRIFKYLITLAIEIALISTISVLMNISSVTLSEVSKDGLLPKIFARKFKNTPIFSLFFMTILSIILCIDNFPFKVINVGAIFSIITVVVNIISYIYMQKNKNKNPFFILSFVILAILLASSCISIIKSRDRILTFIFTLSAFLLITLIFIFRKEYIVSFKNKDLTIAGIVEHGAALGRTIGFPTANLYPENTEELQEFLGVWACFVYIDNEKYNAIANIGTRPSIDEDKTVCIEAHILGGFDSDIYAKKIKIELFKFIRPIIKMNGLEGVKKQLEKDKLKSQEIFNL